MRRYFNTGQVAQGGVEIDELNEPVSSLARFHTWVSYNERDPGVAFKIGVFAPR